MRALGASAAVLAAVVFATAAGAAEPPTCPPDDGSTMSPTRLLRAISLDLRGHVPTVEEYQEVAAGTVPEALIDQWLADPAFVDQAVRHHRSLFWNNVEGVDLIDNDSRLTEIGDVWYVDDGPSEVFRGANDAHCGDFEATLDPLGKPVPNVLPGGVLQEGWVWVTPYWDPANPIKVCAFDAQTAPSTASGTDCTTDAWEDDPECGCGPNLQWCRVSGIEEEIARGFATDVDLRVARVLGEDRSYLDLFFDDVGFLNGPMTHFYRHQTGKPDDVDFSDGAVDAARLPDKPFTDDTFTEVNLGSEHAGVLTSPAWLLRFQTNRSRANRFYNAFLCQPFQPPDGGLTGLDDPNPTLDLTARAGCQYCHALLEPAAAHWGRWPESGAGFLNTADHPAFDPECEACALTGTNCSERCEDHYLVDPLTSEQNDYLGWMLSYEFLEERHMSHVEQGPELLVTETVADGRLPACVAKQTAAWLMGREMTDADQPWIDTLADDFIASDYRYKALVKAILASDNYRRAP